MANTTGLGDTIYAAVKKALEDANGSSGDGGGGGGSSDFTTATVAFILDGYTGLPFVFPVPVIDPDFGLVSYIASSDMDGDYPYDVVMYKGELLLEQPVNGVRFTASTGSIEIQDDTATITGDGTLTISDDE